MRKLASSLLAAALALGAISAYAHSGGTDRNGCHRDSRTGLIHCH